MKKFMLILLLLVVILASCSIKKEEKIVDSGIQVIPTNQSEIRICEEDDECVLVDTNCCCGNTAINKKYYDYWYSQLNCGDVVICPQEECVKPSSTKCINNTCQLIE